MARLLGGSADDRKRGRYALIYGRAPRDRLAPGDGPRMDDVAAHRDGRRSFSSVHFLGHLEWLGNGGVALDRRQNARWRHEDGGGRRCHQNTGRRRRRWALCEKRRAGRLPERK